ncbi:hypothetical protein Tco_0502719 [Tanacetum coccineum]
MDGSRFTNRLLLAKLSELKPGEFERWKMWPSHYGSKVVDGYVDHERHRRFHIRTGQEDDAIGVAWLHKGRKGLENSIRRNVSYENNKSKSFGLAQDGTGHDGGSSSSSQLRFLEMQVSDKLMNGVGFDSQVVDSQSVCSQEKDSFNPFDQDVDFYEKKNGLEEYCMEAIAKGHMTGNKSYLSDYEEIDGGFVAFGGDPNEGRITGKGKISTGDFSVARTPQTTIGVADERKNRNTIESARDYDFLDAGFKPSREEEKMDSKHSENKDSKVPNTEEPRVHQEQDANVNNTNNINTVCPTVNAADIKNNTVDNNIVYGCIDDPSYSNDMSSRWLSNRAFLYRTKLKKGLCLQPSDDAQEIPDEFYEGAYFLLRHKSWDEEVADVDVHLYRSMIGSLMYLTASRPDIMFAVYSPFDLEAFSDSDYAGASLDRKSTTGAEYVAAANCCGQVLWIQNQLLDYGYNFMNTKIFIDNESTICIVKNPVFHSKTKHIIEIRHHFIRDSYEKRLIQVIKIHTDHNVVDLLTKAFDVSRF